MSYYALCQEGKTPQQVAVDTRHYVTADQFRNVNPLIGMVPSSL